MNDTFFIRPAAGLIVKDPETGQPLSSEGEWKSRNSYWRRRLQDRDVIAGRPAAAKTAPKSADTTEVAS